MSGQAFNVPNPSVSGDMAWMLTSSALVLLMTPGLGFFYAGMVNHGAVVSTLMMSYGSIGIVTLMWGLIGYSLAFGPSISSGVVGDTSLGAGSYGDQPRSDYPTVSEAVYSQFQLMFAIITVAIISGAIVQKMKFAWWLAFAAMWHILIYCPLAHWIWAADGWLYKYGVLDFAGGMVVHTSSGVSAFVLTFWLGRTTVKNSPHNVPFVLLGAAMLWFGWYGFNAGSAVAANYLSGRAFANTTNATAVAMLAWNVYEMIFNGEKLFQGKATAVGAAAGAVVGLVAITPACGYVSNMWAFFIGAFAALVVFFTPRMLKPLGVDDRLDCFAFHGVGGMCGTLLTGLFASTNQGDSSANGAFFLNAPQYGTQIAAIMVTLLFSIVGTTVIYWTLWCIATLMGTSMRIPDEEGVEPDASQHGERAYVNTALAEFMPEKAPRPAPGAAAAGPTTAKKSEESVAAGATTSNPMLEEPTTAAPASA